MEHHKSFEGVIDVKYMKRTHRQKDFYSVKKEEFLEWTKSVWTFPAVSAKQIGHPAPFPEELPHRLM